MKNKDKYELSGKDEDLSEKSTSIKGKVNKKELTYGGIETIKPKTNTNTITDIQPKLSTPNSNVVIPENVNEAKNEVKSTGYSTDKYKMDLNKKKDYNKYDENLGKEDYNKYDESLGKIDYNNYDTKEAVQNGNDKSGVNFVILFCVIIAIVIILAMIFSVSNSLDNLDELFDTTIEETEFTDYQEITTESIENFDGDAASFKNIQVEIKESWLGDWIILAKNKGNTDYGTTDISLIFYDENNKIIDVVNQYFSFIPANHTISEIMVEEIPEYYRYDIFYDEDDAIRMGEYDSGYVVEGIGFSDVQKDGYTVNYKVENLTNQKFKYISYTVLIYNDDELVDFRDGYVSELKKGKTDEESIWIDEEIKFDRIEFMINTIKIDE